MSQVEFEPTTPMFDERSQTVHALDGAATVIGVMLVSTTIICCVQTMKTDTVIQSELSDTSMKSKYVIAPTRVCTPQTTQNPTNTFQFH
jgi:hypothetical protein